MNLAEVATDISRIANFIEGGDLAQLLSTVGHAEYAAASAAVRKQHSAVDARQQVWSAINHLETAYEIFATLRASTSTKYLASMRWLANADMELYTLCIMSLCYYYLGELLLARQTLWAAEEAFALGSYPDYQVPFMIVGSIWNPRILLDTYRWCKLPTLGARAFIDQMNKLLSDQDV